MPHGLFIGQGNPSLTTTLKIKLEDRKKVSGKGRWLEKKGVRTKSGRKRKVSGKDICPEMEGVRKREMSGKERCMKKKLVQTVCMCVSVFSRERHNVQMLRASLSEKPGNILLLTIIMYSHSTACPKPSRQEN